MIGWSVVKNEILEGEIGCDLRLRNSIPSKNTVPSDFDMFTRLTKIWIVFFRDEVGATTVEYSLLLSLLLIFGVSATLSGGDAKQVLWFETANSINTNLSPNRRQWAVQSPSSIKTYDRSRQGRNVPLEQ